MPPLAAPRAPRPWYTPPPHPAISLEVNETSYSGFLVWIMQSDGNGSVLGAPSLARRRLGTAGRAGDSFYRQL
ncbi:unnamed protein product [Arctia plantaginis]|uniref:Uncharacterized protein n=1 Tax=Arctia plantaginis TaxID=874455 RepID=A0A8S0ZPB3_ARCPL|nr:unnamed protein product [Arctia plantaginis]